MLHLPQFIHSHIEIITFIKHKVHLYVKHIAVTGERFSKAPCLNFIKAFPLVVVPSGKIAKGYASLICSFSSFPASLNFSILSLIRSRVSERPPSFYLLTSIHWVIRQMAAKIGIFFNSALATKDKGQHFKIIKTMSNQETWLETTIGVEILLLTLGSSILTIIPIKNSWKVANILNILAFTCEGNNYETVKKNKHEKINWSSSRNLKGRYATAPKYNLAVGHLPKSSLINPTYSELGSFMTYLLSYLANILFTPNNPTKLITNQYVPNIWSHIYFLFNINSVM